ncbi:MAG: hypothetical protein Q9215_005513 [Flavoplaca cf. flavocitrina]
MSSEANGTGESTTYTPQRGITKSDDTSLAKTEWVKRTRPEALIRRLSASDAALQGNASLQRPVLEDGTQTAKDPKGDKREVGSFGIPAPVVPPAQRLGRVGLGHDAMVDASLHHPPEFRRGESPTINQDDGLLSPGLRKLSTNDESQGRTASSTNVLDGMETSNAKESDIPPSEQLQRAFATHASREASITAPAVGPNSAVTRNMSSPASPETPRHQSRSTTRANDASIPKAKSKLKLIQRPRTLIHGHKAGLWLTNYSFVSFCHVSNALLLHQWNDLGRQPKMIGPNGVKNFEFSVDIISGHTNKKQVVIFKPFTEAGKGKYEKQILPVLKIKEPKPTIRIRHGGWKCGCEYEEEPSCDNSRDLEVLAPDVGFLRILADWHRWQEPSKLVENSQVFEQGILELLFPSLIHKKNEYTIELPDGSNFHVSRDGYPSLSTRLQEALSRITTAESQEGVEPEQIKLWPYRSTSPGNEARLRSLSSIHLLTLETGLARAKGTIFVHRPANSTHFRYDPPHTMETFFRLARQELYPETKGRLKLRISPSDSFRQTGKLLIPVMERKTSYVNPGEDGDTLEDVWRETIVAKRLRPHEDVWAIKVFVGVQVHDGLRDDDRSKTSEKWDVSALQNHDADNIEDPGWNIPPESIMDGLAMISMKLLNIDPRRSSIGILLRVKREGSSEWLCWNSSLTFLRFCLEVLYKIDAEVIAIYPGDYEEPDETLDQRIEKLKTVEAMRRLERKKTIAADAVQILNAPEVNRNPAKADGRFNNLGHLGIQLPQTIWNAEGTHLEPAPSYSSNALIYSASDMGLLRQRLMRAESEVLMREEACRVCGLTFLKRSGGKDLDRKKEIEDHYASHVMAGPRVCSMDGCEVDLGDDEKYPTWAQLADHLKLHPETSNLRNPDPEASSAPQRESATQTNPNDLDPDFPYESQAEDNLTERPVGDARLWCGICRTYLEDFTQREKENHAKRCNISVDHLEPLEFRQNFLPMETLTGSKGKSTGSRVAHGSKSRTVKSASTVPTAVDESASTTASGRGRRKAAASKPSNELKTQIALETAHQTAAAKGGRAKKTQTGTKATEAALGTHQDTSNLSARGMPEMPGSSNNKPPRKRGPTAKAEDPDDADDPANPPKPGRKPRTTKTQPENQPANTSEDQQPAPPKKTRGPRAKKTNTQPEGTASLQPLSSALTYSSGTSLNPPTSETNTAETNTTTEAKPPPRTTRQTRATATTGTEAPATATLRRNRRTPAPKAPTRSSTRKRGEAAKVPTPDPPPGKKRKVETSEGRVMAQPLSADDGSVVASVEQAVGYDIEGGERDVGNDVEGGEKAGEEGVEAEQTQPSGPGKRKRTRAPKSAAEEGEGKKGGKS